MASDRKPWAGIILMGVFVLWAGALGVGFGLVAFLAADKLGPARLILYLIACAFLVLVAARTLYELVRRLRTR